jgi:D-ornithine 4,5-aminomutase subunit alpha
VGAHIESPAIAGYREERIMARMQERADDYLDRRAHLAPLTDYQLKARFWELCDQITAPLIDLAYSHTSPSIERSVLMRMGLDSLMCQAVVKRVQQAGLLGKGAGHVVLKVMKQDGLELADAARAIVDGRDLSGLFPRQEA